MDRDRAIQYFRELGFQAEPLHLCGQQRHLSPRELIGDGVDGKNLWGSDFDDSVSEVSSADSKTPATPPGPVTVSTACTCRATAVPSRQRPSSQSESLSDNALTSSKSDSESDSDSDEGELSLDKLLAMMVRLHSRPSSAAASSSFMRLASCFVLSEPLTCQHINQLLDFMRGDHTVVKEACLKVILRLLLLGQGPALVSSVELLDGVISIARSAPSPCLQVAAMQVLEQLLNESELDYSQVQDKLAEEVYPCVSGHLHSNAPLEVKFAACCVVRTLARDIEFATKIKRESLFLLRELRHASARLQEAYVGVLMALFAHPGLTEPGSVDTGILPVVTGLLRDGPCETQKQALGLLHCVMCDDHGVEAVSSKQRIIAYVIACLLSSNCRKVRTQASLVLSTVTEVSRKSVAQAVLEGVNHYIHPDQQRLEVRARGGGVTRMTHASRGRYATDLNLWHSLDCFLDSIRGLLHSEGFLELESDHIFSKLPARGEISIVQLTQMSYLVQVVINLCVWSVGSKAVGASGSPQGDRMDLTHLCDDHSIREKYCRLNPRLAVQQWNRFGPSIFAILRWMLVRLDLRVPNTVAGVEERRMSCPSLRQVSSASRPASARSPAPLARCLLGDEEWVLLHTLLNFLLCMSLVSCKKISDPFSEKSCAKVPSPVGSSPVVRTSENPPSSKGDHSVGGLKMSDEWRPRQREDVQKESVSNRRQVRRGMYNEGFIPLVGGLLQFSDPEIKTMCVLILRTAVQPLDEKSAKDATGSPAFVSYGASSLTSAPGRRRPQSAYSLGPPRKDSTSRAVDIALHRMSPASAAAVQEAVGSPSSSPRPSSASASKKPPRSSASSSSRKSSYKASKASRPSSATSISSSQSSTPPPSTRNDSPRSDASHPSISSSSNQSQQKLRPLVPGQPINRECTREAAEQCGAQLIQNLFTGSHKTKVYVALFLHDLVHQATVETHMELSKLGIVPKLLDFIRVNGDSEQLQILGLKVTTMLATSDARLHQLFAYHGGHTLLMALINTPSNIVRLQVKATLAAVSKGNRSDDGGEKRGQRPGTAPVGRRESYPMMSVGQPRDIWEHIMHRWKEEDKVVEVLQKFFQD